MDVREFLGLQPTHNPHRWVLPITPGISTVGNFMFGGCGLAACVAALEQTTGRRLGGGTAQYLSYASPPSILDIDVIVAVAGRHITQARAVGHVCDREILTVNAALGRREFAVEEQWPTMPDVPPPARCPTLPWPAGDGSIASRFDLRLARGHAAARRDRPPSPHGPPAPWV